ncbi:MAG: hypothetical protein ACP5U1_04810 [Desulfomonilaceae bacterium]
MSVNEPRFRFVNQSHNRCTEVMNFSDLLSPMVLSRDESQSPNSNPVTFGQYMEAIKAFVLENLDGLCEIVSQRSGSHASIKLIDLVAEKRGADYFPASIRVKTIDNEFWFAANVALTDRGLSRIRQDYDLLMLLGKVSTEKFLPEVFFINSYEDPSSSCTKTPNLIFLAEWFRGYHEFHVTDSVNADGPVFSLWDTDQGFFEFPESVAIELTEQVAYVLSSFFDLETLQEIYPWHHAAGDFVARLNPSVDLKLITVRQYQPRISFPDHSDGNLIQALLLFLANLSVRARIDRMDGVGQFTWLKGRKFAKAVLLGVLRSVMATKRNNDRDHDFKKKFMTRLRELNVQDWATLLFDTIESYDKTAPDFETIKNNMVDHVFDVYQTCQELMVKDQKYQI